MNNTVFQKLTAGYTRNGNQNSIFLLHDLSQEVGIVTRVYRYNHGVPVSLRQFPQLADIEVKPAEIKEWIRIARNSESVEYIDNE